MRRTIPSLLLAAGLLGAAATTLTPVPSPAQEEKRTDLKGQKVQLSLLGVGGWLPSKLPYTMSGDFAKYAKDKYGYDVTFSYQDAPFSTLFQKAAASLATRSSEFNIIVSDSQWLGAFAEPKWIVNLTDLVKSDPQISKVEWYDPNVVSTYMVYPDGSTNYVGLPQEADVVALFVRKDLFSDPKEREAFKAKEGKDLPQSFEEFERLSMDEFEKVAAFFTRPDKGLAGTVMQHSKEYDFQSMYLYPFMWSQGGEFWDPKTHDVEGVLNTKINADAMVWNKRMLQYEPPGAVNYGIPDNIDAFTQGKVATAFQWAAVGLAMITDANKDKVMVVPPPGFKQADGSLRRLYCMGGQAWVLNNFSTPAQKQASLDFLRWWYLPETQLDFAKRGGNPANKATLEDPNFDSINPWNRALKYMLASGHSRDFYHSPKYSELLSVQQEAMTAYASGAMNDPMKALNWAAGRQQKILYDAGETKKKANPEYLRLQLK